MRPSLLDQVDLAGLRDRAGGLSGPFACLAACLVHGGALAHDPDEPHWADRDRVVAGDEAAAGAVRAALRDAGHPERTETLFVVPPWEALPFAAGLAAASDLDGGIFRIWCLLDHGAFGHGAVWEAARAAAASGIATLTVVSVGLAEAGVEAARVLTAAGWLHYAACPDGPAEVLAALDQCLTAPAPSLVTVTRQ